MGGREVWDVESYGRYGGMGGREVSEVSEVERYGR